MTARADRQADWQGRPWGGPFSFLLLLVLGCGGGGSPGQPTPGAASLTRPLDTYRQLGFLTGSGEFPAVMDVATLAGPGDSTYALFGLSLPNAALRFQRDGGGFGATYRVNVEFRSAGATVRRFAREETVRVPNFAETARSDESVVFQQSVLLAPGRYEMHVRTGDPTTEVVTMDTIDVPAYGDVRRLAGPIFVYEGVGRSSYEALPQIILNPRHTVAYGGAEPNLYLEWYGAGEEVPVRVRVLDERRAEVSVIDAVVPSGASAVRTLRLRLPIDALPLGRLWIEVAAGPGAPAPAQPLVLSISDQWMVANFDEVLLFLHYIATPAEIDALGQGTPAERRGEWERFWDRRDPIPATPQNEFRDAFFERVRYATEQFGEPGGLPGWRTDRGEVYIVLGAPDLERDRVSPDDPTQSDGIEWRYESLPGGRLSLLFVDRTGFGRYRLTPASAAAFRTVADRLKPR